MAKVNKKNKGAVKAPVFNKKDKTNTKKKKVRKARIVRAVTNAKAKLVDLGVIKPINYMSSTESTMSKFHSLIPLKDGRRFKLGPVKRVSCTMKLVLKLNETNEMSEGWTRGLWNISQSANDLPKGVNITFVRSLERLSNVLVEKKIKRSGILGLFSNDTEKSMKSKRVTVRHNAELQHAIEVGSSTALFGAEAIITAKNEVDLEKAVRVIKDYLKHNDELRGLSYQIDINHQNRPLIMFGMSKNSGNHELSYHMTSFDAGQSALFVDSGGDRAHGAEYVGVSIGKYITSHAAYSFKHSSILLVGNNKSGQTHVMGGDFNEPSQMYLSKVVSRAFALDGQNVVHLVMDNPRHVRDLMRFGLDDRRKVMVDASKGMLNILEMIDDGILSQYPERVRTQFGPHIDNIIAQFSLFRDKKASTVDDFAKVARDILTAWFVDRKYWTYNAKFNLKDIRLLSPHHEQMDTLASFGAYIAQRLQTEDDVDQKSALRELDAIINSNILATIPALDTHTDPLIDELVKVPYRVVDLTGFSTGRMKSLNNPSLNLMVIAYLNMLLPTLKNGDVVFLHGLQNIKEVSDTVLTLLRDADIQLNVVVTTGSQSDAVKAMTIHEKPFKFTVVDLYQNEVDELLDPLAMDHDWTTMLSERKTTFFFKTNNGIDYIYLDNIL